MKKTILSIAVLCVAIAVVVSCQKDYSNYKSDEPTLSGNQLFGALRPAAQKFAVPVGMATTIQGAKGGLMTFYPNSFKDKNGNIITSGTVNIELVEMYSAGDMIANRASTVMDDGTLLRSVGQVNMNVTMNGEEVFANKYSIAFPVKEASSDPMRLYYGNTSNEDSVVRWNRPGWTVGMEASGTTEVSNGTGIKQSPNANYSHFYVFDSCTSFRYVNGDYTLGTNSINIPAKISFPEPGYSRSNTNIYVLLPTYNCVMNFNISGFDSTKKNCFGTLRLPIGAKYKIVTLTNKKEAMSGLDNFYYYETFGLASSDTIKVNAAVVRATKDSVSAWLTAF